jgi:cation:H+ antiporter
MRRMAPWRDAAWLGLALAMPLPWLGARCLSLALAPELVAPLAGGAILGAAFLLSWATELGERDIPQSLALLVLALVSVLPEYAVDLHFAIRAGQDPSYAHYAVANMTGANRLLIGLGWAAVVLVALARSGGNSLRIHPNNRLEIRFLVIATLFSFTIPLSGTLNLLDAAVLLGLFGWYVVAASRGSSEHVALVGPAAWIDARTGDRGRRLWAVGLLLFSASAIFLSAEPFAEGLVHLGRNYAVDEFLLVQWVAPLASESPEFAIAILFALRGRGSLGIGALISAKVNQWTLLVGALPIAYGLSAGTTSGLPLDARQTEELLLTSAQSLLAAVLIVELEFSRGEAVLLASLFGVQLLFPTPEVRTAFAVLYVIVALGLVAHSPMRRRALLALVGRVRA